MKKVCVISDLHLDHNEHILGIDILTDCLIPFLKKNKIDVFVFGGDSGGSLSEFIRLQKKVVSEGIVFWGIPGNHEMWDRKEKDSWSVYEKLREFSRPLVLGNHAIVGNMGWYDYSTASDMYSTKELDKMKGWMDKSFCRWNGMSNQDVAAKMLADLDEDLSSIDKNKKIIGVTHIVPFKQFIEEKPWDFRWNYTNAFIGNTNIGKKFLEYNTKEIFFGHTHSKRYARVNGVEVFSTPFGYCRHNEWAYSNPTSQIEHSCEIFEID